jgi:hypothetical protein
MPHLEAVRRWIAPHPIDIRDRGEPPDAGSDSHRAVEHRRYFDTLLDLRGVKEARHRGDCPPRWPVFTYSRQPSGLNG